MATVCGIVTTPWGRVGVEVGNAGIRRVTFHAPPAPALTGVWAAALIDYINGVPVPMSLPVDLSGIPPFSRQVLEACRAIPFGQTISYAGLAAQLGRPRAARAVGQALAKNPIPMIIPCHRVIGADGRLTGFLGGLEWKRQLLVHEGAFAIPVV